MAPDRSPAGSGGARSSPSACRTGCSPSRPSPSSARSCSCSATGSRAQGVGSALYLPIILVAVAAGPVGGALGGPRGRALLGGADLRPRPEPRRSCSPSQAASTCSTSRSPAPRSAIRAAPAGAARRVAARARRLARRRHGRRSRPARAAASGSSRRSASCSTQGRPVALLLGHAGADTDQVASPLSRSLGPNEELVRVGDRRPACSSPALPAEAADLVSRYEREAAANGLPLALGCAATPDDGEDLLGLVAAAAERLQARAASAV